jgi:hypothetical protein
MTDFSRSPDEVLADNVSKGYVGLRIEQGVPILDRDLNLIQDLASVVVRSIVSRYIGGGLPAGSEGFAVAPIPAASNNFRILAGSALPGTCLVGGIEVAIAADVVYTAQAGVPALTTPTLAQPNPRDDTVYLDVGLQTVDGTSDADLLNPADIGTQTSVRLRPVWVVRVAENATSPPAPAPGRSHLVLARLKRDRGVATIDAKMIADVRQTRLTLGDVEQRLSNMERLLLTPALDTPSFSPVVGFAGQAVTLKGRNLNLAPVQVLFGAVAASVTSVAPTQVVTAVPPGVAGSVPVTVITTGGSVTSMATFLILGGPPTFAPSPNQFSPKVGPVGQAVTLSGTNFNQAPVQVQFGAVTAAVNSSTTTQIVTQVPAGAAGALKIRVTTPAGTVLSNDNFTVL